MRRTRLVWFAIGAGSAALVAIIGNWYLQPTVIEHNWTAYLILTEPLSETDSTSSDESRDLAIIANKTGSILRDCGARVFETTFLNDHHLPTADFPIILENYRSLECVIREAQNRGVSLQVETRGPSRAVDEMRSAD